MENQAIVRLRRFTGAKSLRWESKVKRATKTQLGASNSPGIAIKFKLMMENVVNTISARQAVATVNEWLVSYIGDRFLAGTPSLDPASDLWRVPILYVYPQEGSLGSVGEVTVDALTGEMRTHPTVDEIKGQALNLYKAQRATDDTAIPPSRD